jgi:hypothetical protein
MAFDTNGSVRRVSAEASLAPGAGGGVNVVALRSRSHGPRGRYAQKSPNKEKEAKKTPDCVVIRSRWDLNPQSLAPEANAFPLRYANFCRVKQKICFFIVLHREGGGEEGGRTREREKLQLCILLSAATPLRTPAPKTKKKTCQRKASAAFAAIPATRAFRLSEPCTPPTPTSLPVCVYRRVREEGEGVRVEERWVQTSNAATVSL